MEIDCRNIDIVVLGESMAGKTTYILGLLREDVRNKLESICKNNYEGQTKIKTVYRLMNPNNAVGICVNAVDVVAENLNHIICSEDTLKSEIRDVLSELHILKVNDKKDNEGISNEQIIHINLADKDIFLEKLYHQVINNKEFAETDIIRSVEIGVSASQKVWEIINNNGLENVTVSDTRGLLDETESFKDTIEKVRKLDEKNIDDKQNKTEKEKELIRKLLDERGVLNADGCVVIAPGGGRTLNIKEYRERYGFLYSYISSTMPVFIINRNDVLTGILDKIDLADGLERFHEIMDMNENYKFKGELKHVRSHMNLIELLESYEKKGEEEKGALQLRLSKDNMCFMLLPEIDIDEEREYLGYIYSVNGVFDKVVSVSRKFKDRLKRFIYENNSLPEKIRNEFKEKFRIDFEKYIIQQLERKFDPLILSELRLSGYAEKIRLDYLYGGFLGPRGGMTTWIKGEGMVGRYAIGLLVFARKQFEEISRKICNDWKLDFSEENRLLLESYFSRMLSRHTFSYSCTESMISSLIFSESFLEIHNEMDENKEVIKCVFYKEYGGDVAIVYRMLDIILRKVIDSSEKKGIMYHDMEEKS